MDKEFVNQELEFAAKRTLTHLTGSEDSLTPLYLQSDRALFLAENLRIIFKVYMKEKALQHDYAIAQKVASIGVPIPEILGFEAGQPAVLAMKQVMGRPLSSHTQSAAKEAGNYLQRFHTLGAHPPFSGGQQQWEAFISWWANEEIEKVKRLAVLDHQQIRELHEQFETLRPFLVQRPIVLFEHLPTTLHIVIATRSDPPLPLARLRARNAMTGLRAADLRFSLDETTAFLNDVAGFQLSIGDIARLELHTEGWIAGLQLVALLLQGKHDIAQFLATVSGSHRHVREYLIEEVFSSQPEPIQTFLLQTSLFDRRTGSLCDAVTGGSDGECTLEDLERANLFLLPLDEAQHWYRYHALFAEALRLLERWQADAHAQERSGSELAILVLSALASYAQGESLQAQQTVVQALSLAQPEGYKRLFLEEGIAMAALLRTVRPRVSEPVLAAYIDTLLTAFEEERPEPLPLLPPPAPSVLMEPLSLTSQAISPLRRSSTGDLRRSEIAVCGVLCEQRKGSR